MRAGIDKSDMKYLKTFPDARRTDVMQKIMSRPPEKTVVLDGNNHFEKTLIKLRRNGFGLIDLQPQEQACSTVWYRKSPSLLKRCNEEVAMVLWEAHEQSQATTLITWQV